MKGANFDGRHDNGDGRYRMATGGTTTRHDSGKGQQGDRMHDHFDGRHDDDMGQQGNRRRDDEGRTGGATMRGVAVDKEGSGGATTKARWRENKGAADRSTKIAAQNSNIYG